MRILFLDDEIERQALYQFRHPADEIVFATTYQSAVEAFEREARFDLADLDFQLNDVEIIGDKPFERTGMTVVRFMLDVLPAAKWPREVVCHSLNHFNRMAMVKTLSSAGIRVREVPFH